MLRRSIVVAALAAFLVPAASAPAQANEAPELLVTALSSTLTRAVGNDIELTIPRAAPATARVEVHVPAGYGGALTQPPRADIAIALMEVLIGGRSETLLVDVTVADPGAYTQHACAPGTHTAVWVGQPLLSNRSFSFPIFVDRIVGEEAAQTSFKLTFCLPSPDEGAQPAGSPPGMKLLDLELSLNRVFTNPSEPSLYVWKAFVTPYVQGTAAENQAGTFELRSIVPLPQSLALKVRLDRKKRTAIVSGKLTVLGKAEPDAPIFLYAGPSADKLKLVRRLKTRRDGTFSARVKVTRTMFFGADEAIYFGPCDPAGSTAPGGCVRQTWSGAFSQLVRLRVPKR